MTKFWWEPCLVEEMLNLGLGEFGKVSVTQTGGVSLEIEMPNGEISRNTIASRSGRVLTRGDLEQIGSLLREWAKGKLTP